MSERRVCGFCDQRLDAPGGCHGGPVADVAAAVGGVSDDRIAQLEALADDWHEWAQAIVNGDQAARARRAVYLRCSSELRTILEGKR